MSQTLGCADCGRSQGMSTSPCPACSDAPPLPSAALPFVPALADTAGRPSKGSRWSSSDTTFGPVGRVLATIGLLVPVPLFVLTAGMGFGLLGGGIWVFVILPWGLRDVWRHSRRR